MITLDDFRDEYLRDITDKAETTMQYPVNIFIDNVIKRFKDDLGIKSEIEYCYVDYRTKDRKNKPMRLDAASVDEKTFEVNLFLADFNEDSKQTIGKSAVLDRVKLLVNFFKNALAHFYSASTGSPEAIIAEQIYSNIESINRLHLYIFTTDQLSNRLKEFDLPSLDVGGKILKMKLDIVDIERLYKNLEGPEEFEIDVAKFNFPPIPCVKAEIGAESYDAYLAIVPGGFLAEIYKEYGAKLLKANVRSFLNMTGEVNKGIRETIRREPEKFFTYNNGISTTAKDVKFKMTENGLVITSFTCLQIINGGQTTASLALTSLKEKLPLDKIFVQMKLTIVKVADKDLVRNIAKYANSQTKVTATDLNSSHEFYIELETLSRRLFTPVAAGAIKPTKWFFERTKKQYEQPTMQMTKAQKKHYQDVYPKKQKMTVTDVAKYLHLAEMKPFDVAWGADINARRFHDELIKKWDIDCTFCDEIFFRELVGKALLYQTVAKVVKERDWYKAKTGNFAQLVAYTYAKFVYEANQLGLTPDYRNFWNEQETPDVFNQDIGNIAKLIFDVFYDPNASHTDVREYCKREKLCWNDVKTVPYSFSPETRNLLIEMI